MRDYNKEIEINVESLSPYIYMVYDVNGVVASDMGKSTYAKRAGWSSSKDR